MNTAAIVFVAPRHATLGEIPLPEPGPDELGVRTLVSAVSVGTERWALLDRRPEMKFPQVPGYLGVGVVEHAAEGFAVGERVFFTNARLPQPYASHSWMSTHVARAVVSTRVADDWPPYVCRVPEAIDAVTAALTGLAAVAVQGTDMLRLERGQTALVLGLGVIGQCAAQLLRAQGMRVVGTDLDPGRVALAREHSVEVGATLVASEPIAPQLGAALPSGGFDVVVDTTSAHPVLAQLDALVRHRGQILLQGYYPGLTPFNLDRLHGRRPTIAVACSLDLKAHLKATREIEASRLHLRPLVTRMAAPGGAPQVYADILDHPDRFLGVVFDWTRSA